MIDRMRRLWWLARTLVGIGVLTDGARAPIGGVVPVAETENWSRAVACLPDAYVAVTATPQVPASVRSGVTM